MGTVIGSLFGAAFLILLGNAWKGRDFMVLAGILAAIAIALGALLSPAITIASQKAVADTATSVSPDTVAAFFLAGACYVGVVALGLFFIAPSRSAKN